VVAWSPYGKELGGQLLDDLPNRSGVPEGSLSGLNKFEGPDPALWVANGYVVLNPDTRGAYQSSGNLVFWGRQLAEDGYDFIEWAAAQDWSNGRIGLAGTSWLAISQWFIAAERPPHLAAIAPWEGLSDPMREVLLRGGIPMLDLPELIVQTLAGEHLVEDVVRMVMTEQDDTLYWQDKCARLEQVEVPAYVVASYDHFLHTLGTLEAFRRIASRDKWLRIHNTQEWPDFYDPRWSAELLAFFDHYLKGEANDWPKTPRVRIAVLDPGDEDELCRAVDAWPPAGYAHERLYLTADGALSAQAPAAETSIRYAARSGPPPCFRARFDARAELIGYLKLKLWVEADGADDMDLVVVVEKLDSEGRPIARSNGTGQVKPLQAFGFQRASRRRLDPRRSTESQPVLLLQGEERLAPGQVVPLEIAIWPTGLTLHAGEMLQVMVAPFHAQPLALPFGSARTSIPVEGFTYRPGAEVELMTLGGDVSTSPRWSRDQAVVDAARDAGTHILHLGGRYDSHLLVPLRRS
jgi:predicted acyl esterase